MTLTFELYVILFGDGRRLIQSSPKSLWQIVRSTLCSCRPESMLTISELRIYVTMYMMEYFDWLLSNYIVKDLRERERFVEVNALLQLAQNVFLHIVYQFNVFRSVGLALFHWQCYLCGISFQAMSSLLVKNHQ